MNKNTITAYFQADHDRLDQLFARFQRSKGGDVKTAARFFRHFRNGLQRHIVWEEEILFPVFEAKAGMARGTGPTEVMRREHRLIEDLLKSVHDKVRAADPATEEPEMALLAVLGGHNMKEEHILYPAIDQQVSEEEAAEIFAAMEEAPEEKRRCGYGSHAHVALTRAGEV